MSRKANPTIVGIFVIGALALLVAGVVLFGSGKFFRPTLEYVAYFEGSVGGLLKGAPVKFHGVRIGAVTDIRVEVDMETEKTEMLQNVFGLGQTQVNKIMIPKGDMVLIGSSKNLIDAADMFSEHRYSRLPVYQGKEENIIGLLYQKDTFDFIRKNQTKINNKISIEEDLIERVFDDFECI